MTIATSAGTCHRGATRFDVESGLEAGMVHSNISPKTVSGLAVAHP